MRGFSMFLVVFAHVFIGFGLEGSATVLGNIIGHIRMPLFFFVSGFFAFRTQASWNCKLYKRVLSLKLKAQVFGTIVFFALLSYTRNAEIFGWIHHGFRGYWFTIVLFQMFLVYISGTLISKLTKHDIVIPYMIIISVIFLALFNLHLIDHVPLWDILNWANLCLFLQYFTLGLICRKYSYTFIQYISYDTTKTILIIGFVLLTCLSYLPQIRHNDLAYKFLSIFILPYFGLLLLISLFQNARTYFNKCGVVQNTLCLIGRRTLDIYMLHYFFLPTIKSLQDFLTPNNMIIMQIMVGTIIAGIIIAVCILISNSLRASDTIAEWLFGVRKRSIA